MAPELRPHSGLECYFSANAVRAKRGTSETCPYLGQWYPESVSTNLQAGLSYMAYPVHGSSFQSINSQKNGAKVKYGCSRSHRWLDFLSPCCVADTAERHWGFCVCLQLEVQKVVSAVSKRMKIIQAEDRLWFRQDAWKLAGAELIISHLCILLSGKVLPLF